MFVGSMTGGMPATTDTDVVLDPVVVEPVTLGVLPFELDVDAPLVPPLEHAAASSETQRRAGPASRRVRGEVRMIAGRG